MLSTDHQLGKAAHFQKKKKRQLPWSFVFIQKLSIQCVWYSRFWLKIMCFFFNSNIIYFFLANSCIFVQFCFLHSPKNEVFCEVPLYYAILCDDIKFLKTWLPFSLTKNQLPHTIQCLPIRNIWTQPYIEKTRINLFKVLFKFQNFLY